jgi:superfamily II RNA helicase
MQYISYTIYIRNIKKMIRICDLTKKPEHTVTTYAAKYTFPLDIFQEHAISAIDQGHNVLVTAKTGSGKTLVGEYQIAHSLKQGKRVFYTTPIKSLSNQKFYDLRQMMPEDGAVGIMTGDIKFCPDAKVIVMTTEILRNLLYKQGTVTEHLGLTASLSLEDLGAVVFDECHYINDRDRGKVWEETMILLPKSVQLIMLSATLDKPEFFAEWIGSLKEVPCHLIQTQHRVVPLTHYILQGSNNLQAIMDSKEVFYDGVYADWVRSRNQLEKDHEAYQKKVAAARRQGVEGAISGKVKPVSFIHQLNGCISMLREKGLLPALAFVLSRKGCETYAAKTEATLLDSSDSAAATNIFDFHLRRHKQSLETLPQYHAIRTLIGRGIAFHHSGVLPLLKESVEILFTKGYIKLLYCTETFAVGINMPTKTVIFTGLSKYDDATGGMRFLRTDEYIQMAGRAGRRGKDPVGTVLYLPDRDPPSTGEMRTILKGGRPQIQSRMDFHYDFLLKTFQAKEIKWLTIQEQSYWYRQQQHLLETEKKARDRLESELESIVLDASMKEELEQREDLERKILNLTNAKRRDAQRQLDRWKDEHKGPSWIHAEESWKKQRHSAEELKSVKESIACLTVHKGGVETWIKILQETGFLEGDDSTTLTTKGILATEFNEGHPLLCAEFFTLGYHKTLSGDELLTVLASLIEEKVTDTTPSLADLKISSKVRTALQDFDSIVRVFQDHEEAYKQYSKESYWTLCTTWIEPVQRWLEGESASVICTDYGLFEGNFVRTILRIANMADEWIAVGTYTSDIEMLEKLQDVRTRLVRDFLVPDSLYLHL